MKFYKHPLLNKNRASTRPGVRPLGTLFVFLLVSSFRADAVPFQETTIPKTFADWCLNKNNSSVETLHSVDVLLEVAKTTDCNIASNFLSRKTPLALILTNKQITDLRALSFLTNLTGLDLGNNQITDLKPLSNLINLRDLFLYNNQSDRVFYPKAHFSISRKK
jgi:internalin A